MINTLPAAPTRTMTAAQFVAAANAFLAALPAFSTQVNADVSAILQLTLLVSTSTTSLTIGTGSKSLTVQTAKAYLAGQTVRIYSTATPDNYMDGTVTSYDSGTGALVVNVTSVGGSGTLAAWTVTLNGGLATSSDLTAAVALRALLAGSASQVFSVATATAAAHAVRLEQERYSFRNAAINGDMSVSQVNGTTLVTTGIAADTYVIDQMIVNAATAAVTAGQSTDATGLPVGFRTNLKISGAASNAGIIVKHRIEAKDTARFAGKKIAVSFYAYQDSGAAFASATVKAFCPTTTADVFSALTQEGATQAVSIANAGTIAKYTAIITMGAANVAKGLEIDIDTASGLLAGKTMYVTGLQIEAVASDAAVVTEFEFIPHYEQLRRCQRYLPCFNYPVPSSVFEAGGFSGATTIYAVIAFPFETRIPPTGMVTSTIGNFLISSSSGAASSAASSAGMSWASTNSARISFTGSAVFAANQTGLVYVPATTSKIHFTGAQL